MSEGNNIKKFTAIDIEKYHKGLLNATERHALEKAALDDPMLADALEGYSTAGIDVSADLAELRRRLSERTEDRKLVPISRRNNYFLRIAAVLVLLAGAGYLVWQFTGNKRNDQLAQNKPQPTQQVTPGTDRVVVNDSNGNIKTVTPTVSGTVQPINNVAKEKKPAIQRNAGEFQDDSVSSKHYLVKEAPVKNENTGIPTTPAKAAERTNNEDLTARVTSRDEEKDLARNAVAPKRDDGSITDDRKKVAASRGADEQYRNLRSNTFRGRVTDNSNSGVPFANVTNVQDNAGTYTDANGYFALTSPDSVLNVQVHSVGFANNNVQIRNDASLNKIVLQEDRKGLSEVVVSNNKPNSTARVTNNIVLDEPTPADGWEKYDSYLANNLVIPDEFKTQKSTPGGSVQLSFEVNKLGEPINIKVEKSLCSSCDKEAIRLVKQGPKWKRNARNGRTTVTINF